MKEQFLQLRKKILEDEFSFLNQAQKTAVFHWEAPLLILAGAGSGKTTVIVNKISYLMQYGRSYTSDQTPDSLTEDDLDFLKSCLTDKEKRQGARYRALTAVDPVDPYHILAITFTNKAAAEMQDRIEKKCGFSSGDLWALTFHATCVRLLRRFIDVLGYDRGFSIYDESDSLKLLETIIKKMNLSDQYKPKTIKNYISKGKGAYLDPDAFARSFENYYHPKTPEIYREYQRCLQEANALDFDDLIFLTVKLLEEYPEIAEKVHRRFRYILVDEYQDTNPLQYRLVSLLSQGGILCVVGDDDQSIYRFMGASVGNILNFEKDFSHAEVLRLEQNYRSTGVILDAANAVIGHNKARKGKTLWTEKKGGEKIFYSNVYDQREEGDYICRKVSEGVLKGKKYGDYCVLYRTNAQSNSLEMALRGNGIPYRIFGGLAFFKRKEVQDILAYLSVIANPRDTTRIRRIINEPKRGIGAATVEKIAALADSKGTTFYEILQNAGSYASLSSASGKLLSFARLLENFRTLSETLPLSELFTQLYEAIGYDAMLRTSCDSNEYRSRTENIKELLSSIVQFEDDARKMGNEPSLQGYLEQTALVSATDSLSDSDDAVVLMTMHCAKGLEFDTVFVSGFEEGLFPSPQSCFEEEDLEEERRLCYVTITRAKEHLHLLSAKSRLLYGRVVNGLPSRFLQEIPSELLDSGRPAPVSVSSPVSRKTGMHGLSPEKKSGTALSSGMFAPSRQTAAKPAYRVGQKVRHRTFGSGEVLSVVAMTSDALLEVRFDGVGVKKLMSNFAKLEIEDEV